MTLGERLKQVREQHHYSQIEIANVLHVSRQAVSKWENDQSIPEIEKIEKLAKLYNMSLEELLNPDQKKKKENHFVLASICCWIGFLLCIVIGTALQPKSNIVYYPPINPDNPTGTIQRKELVPSTEAFDESQAIDLYPRLSSWQGKDTASLLEFKAYPLEKDTVRFQVKIETDYPYYIGFVSAPNSEYFHYESEIMEPGETEFVFDVDLSSIKNKEIEIILSAIDPSDNERVFLANFIYPFDEEIENEAQ